MLNQLLWQDNKRFLVASSVHQTHKVTLTGSSQALSSLFINKLMGYAQNYE